MRRRHRRSIPTGGIAVVCACAITILLQHCGGSTIGGASPGSGGTGAGQGDAGAVTGQGGASQGCATTMIDSPRDTPCTGDADCPSGWYCGEILPGGYRTCLRHLVVNTKCSTDAAEDACGCNGKTCPSGSSCVFAPIPCGTGGTGPNECETGCTPGACPSGQACVRGLQPVIGACYPAACRTDQDCGGCSRCAPAWSECDGAGDIMGLECTCRTDADCRPGLHCVIVSSAVGFCR